MTRNHFLLRLALPLGLILVIGLIVACGPPSHVRTRVTIGVGYFWDHLAVYGDWVYLDAYGCVWSPWDVGPHWRPYTRGHWIHTLDGWTWVDELRKPPEADHRLDRDAVRIYRPEVRKAPEGAKSGHGHG